MFILVFLHSSRHLVRVSGIFYTWDRNQNWFSLQQLKDFFGLARHSPPSNESEQTINKILYRQRNNFKCNLPQRTYKTRWPDSMALKFRLPPFSNSPLPSHWSERALLFNDDNNVNMYKCVGGIAFKFQWWTRKMKMRRIGRMENKLFFILLLLRVLVYC